MDQVLDRRKEEEHSDFKFISDSMIDIYDSIMRIEESEIRKSRFKDVTAKELHLIHAIGLHAHKTTSEVANYLKLSKGTLTANINTLERKGYVKRVPNQVDRRIINLELTDKGRILFRAHSAFHSALVKSVLDGFSDDNVEIIEQVLKRLLGFIDEVSDK
ncbi:MarR family transcriptional regulator [Lentilactobacillus curieae]|uniref:MarR family transcriptional regulator n=1 Tax=Lentilactobacillus curieae TaxID=1138822 RepID=A0A1S6QJ45_9LACO|nr:MarR family transcriptional regulator [Lentilactobacillus curieae]AQW21648.1 MarR family transcriptional regulator [Lentilactobacillus curieae]